MSAYQTKLHEAVSKLSEPLIVGIAGDSGSGKTKFSEGIRKLLGSSIVQTIEMDGYHKENRLQRKNSKRSPLEPEANNFQLLRQHLGLIKRREPFAVPIYNHERGDFDTPRTFNPSPVVILEGLHALYPEFTPFIDFTIYVDPARSIKWQWKKERDIIVRGHDEHKLLEEMYAREALYKRWIDFQKTNATVVIKILPTEIPKLARYEYTGVMCTDCYKYELIMEPPNIPLPSVPIPLDLSFITDNHTPSFLLASVASRYWGKAMVTVHVDGELHPQTVAALNEHVESFCSHKEMDTQQEFRAIESIREALDPVSTTRFTQLLIAWRFLALLSEKATHDSHK